MSGLELIGKLILFHYEKICWVFSLYLRKANVEGNNFQRNCEHPDLVLHCHKSLVISRQVNSRQVKDGRLTTDILIAERFASDRMISG